MPGRSTVAAVALALSLGMVGVGAASAATVLVSNANDDGAGSFRGAIAAANSDTRVTRIQFVFVSTIFLEQTVEFSGPQDLIINGGGATLDGFESRGRRRLPGDRRRRSRRVRPHGAQRPRRRNCGSGAAVGHRDRPISLANVDIIDNLGHGVLVNDQEDDSTPEDAQPPANGSAASVDVSVFNARFIRNGYSVSDRDGLRVNEGGDGDLPSRSGSVSEDNGADGIEADERGPGDVRVDMFGTRLTGNGPFDPTDLDDGFDIDEWDAGSIFATVVFSSASNNLEEGFDFNENNDGDLRVDMQLVEANGNGEEGIDLEEDDDFGDSGDLVAPRTDRHVRQRQRRQRRAQDPREGDGQSRRHADEHPVDREFRVGDLRPGELGWQRVIRIDKATQQRQHAEPGGRRARRRPWHRAARERRRRSHRDDVGCEFIRQRGVWRVR